MKRNCTIRCLMVNCGGWVILMLIISSFQTPGLPTKPAGDGLVVIRNPHGTPQEIDFEELVRVMKGHKPRWNDGTKTKLALMKPKTTVGARTAKIFYGMTPAELSKYWLTMVFEGKSSPPEFFYDEADLIKYVSKTEGAIGIVSDHHDVLHVMVIKGMPEVH